MVKITYKGQSRDIPAQYLKGLKGKDREKQIKSIFEGTIRPKTKATEKRSSHVIKFEKKYGKKITDEEFIHKNIITRTGQKKIMDKALNECRDMFNHNKNILEDIANNLLEKDILNSNDLKIIIDKHHVTFLPQSDFYGVK